MALASKMALASGIYLLCSIQLATVKTIFLKHIQGYTIPAQKYGYMLPPHFGLSQTLQSHFLHSLLLSTHILWFCLDEHIVFQNHTFLH